MRCYMKKLIILFAVLILFAGCDIRKMTDADIDKIIEDTLDNKVQGANKYFKGYKYYMPRGFVLSDKKGDNHILLSNGDNYYLYVDIVSYYHREKVDVTFDNELYFSKKISYNDNEGYIKIDKKEKTEEQDKDIYYIEIVYNYSKIEAFVKEENLEYALKNSIIILSSIKYNDVILDTIIGDRTLDYKEEAYDFFDSKREEGTFLDYIEEYDVYKDDTPKDEDVLDSVDE